MEFFKKEDLDYYSSVIGKKHNTKSKDWEILKTRLTKDGVFAKTGYWANLIKGTGYSINFRNDCQFSGNIRSYTWAKIYIKDFEKTDIFFTVGVGSRFKNRSKVFDLVYKIDCQRKKGLAPYQVQLFDDFIKKSNLDHSYKLIDAESLSTLNWDKLVDLTLGFIDKWEETYKQVAKVVWPNGTNLKPKVARLCWNDLGWEKPSGLEGKSQNTDHAFESNGYGHEEWLFDLDRIINGYHYGFIQAFNKGKHHGNIYDVHLYTSKFAQNKNSWYWVGRIKKTEVLTRQEQKEIFEIYRANDWYQEMMQELKDVDVESRDLEIVSEEELFNVKFKVDQNSFLIFDELKPISDPKGQIGLGYGRYGLKDLFTKTASVENSINQYKFKAGHKQTKTGTTKSVYTKKTIDRTLKHKEIQEYMYHQLVKVHGIDNVGTEVPTGIGTNIDVVVVQNDKTEWFYEVKPYNQPLICIREAFGQILEYAMFSQNNHADKLIIVGINEPSQSEKNYLKHLRKTTDLNIYYQVFNLSQKYLLELMY